MRIVPDSHGSEPAPLALKRLPEGFTPLNEANDCHEPAGSSKGGQFCSGAKLEGGHQLELDEDRDTTHVWVRFPSGSAGNFGRVEQRDGEYFAKAEDVHLGVYGTKDAAVEAVLTRSRFKANAADVLRMAREAGR